MGLPRSTQRGFTLIELMIVVVVVAILSMIALPSYNDYIRRGKIAEATSQLGQWRTKMEQYCLDNRTYVNGGGVCGAPVPTGGDIKCFAYTCPGPSASTFTLQAVGVATEGMGGFTYTIDQTNARQTTAAPAGWAAATMPTNCWISKKGGIC
jgi:type IV pilus assembly protein PilE